MQQTTETFGTYNCTMGVKHMQHPNKNTCKLQHENTYCNILVGLKTAETFRTYSCNISVKHVQHPDKKRLQHTSETDETF
jgi:hypothetical protein